MANIQIIHGDWVEQLKTLPSESVQCVVTSPPYWGLRDYGVTGQLGLEKTPEEYVEKMVSGFREVKRVLRNDGTAWLNLGDSYLAQQGKGGTGQINIPERDKNASLNIKRPGWLKPKDLVGIPWRTAFALQQPYYSGKIKKEIDRVWLASMIDGEGCMFIHKRKTGQSNGQGYERKNDTYGAGLEVANTHESIVNRCMEITGLGSICRVERESKNKHRNIPLYRWNMRSNQCRDIIREIYPYLVGKQHEARLLLGCPSSGLDAGKAHYSLMALHNGKDATIDFPAPKSLYEPGWFLRQDCIWSKLNPMPESVTDRCTKSHEYIFLLTKSARYFYDNEAIKEPCVYMELGDRKDRASENHKSMPTEQRNGIRPKKKTPQTFGGAKARNGEILEGDPRYRNGSEQWGRVYETIDKRNKRSVWNISTQPYKEAHFATSPPEIPRTCILAGSKEGDTILDPFCGSGTTGEVALKLNRNFIGIELNEKYVNNLIIPRLENVDPLFRVMDFNLDAWAEAGRE